MSKTAAEVLGISNLARDMRRQLAGHIYADSSSALAVVARRGAGKLRHININHLWLQEIEKRDKDPVKFEKIDGTDNPADAMTKYLDRKLIERYLEWSGHQIVSGRAKLGLKLQDGALDNVTFPGYSSTAYGTCAWARPVEDKPIVLGRLDTMGSGCESNSRLLKGESDWCSQGGVFGTVSTP